MYKTKPDVSRQVSPWVDITAPDTVYEEFISRIDQIKEGLQEQARDKLMDGIDALIEMNLKPEKVADVVSGDLVKVLLGVVLEFHGDFQMAIHILTWFQKLLTSDKRLFRNGMVKSGIVETLMELMKRDPEFTEISLNISALLLEDDDMSKELATRCFKPAFRNLERMDTIKETDVLCSFFFLGEALRVRALDNECIFRLVRLFKAQLLARMPHPYFSSICLCVFHLFTAYESLHSIDVAQLEFKFIWQSYLGYNWNMEELCEMHPLICVISVYQCIFYYCDGEHLGNNWNSELQKLMGLLSVENYLLRERVLKVLAIAAENVPDPAPFYENLPLFLSCFDESDTYDFKASLANTVISLIGMPKMTCDNICEILTSQAFQFMRERYDDIDEWLQGKLKHNITVASKKFVLEGQIPRLTEVLDLPTTPIEAVIDGSWITSEIL